MSLLKLIPVNVGSNSLCLWGYKQNLDKVKVPERGPSKVQTEVLVKYLPQVTYVDEIRIFCLNTYFLHDIWCCFCMMFWCLWFPIVFLNEKPLVGNRVVFFQAGKDDDMLEDCEGSDEAIGHKTGIVDRCGMVSSHGLTKKWWFGKGVFFFPPRICWCNISIVRDCTVDVGDAI